MMLPHSDKTLNILRLMAFGAVGFYMLKVYQKQGSLSGLSGNPDHKISINTDRVVDYIMPHVDLPPNYKSAVEAGTKEFLKGYLESKGIRP
jgi:hypothetical protein